jgi:hypothetical protein
MLAKALLGAGRAAEARMNFNACLSMLREEEEAAPSTFSFEGGLQELVAHNVKTALRSPTSFDQTTSHADRYVADSSAKMKNKKEGSSSSGGLAQSKGTPAAKTNNFAAAASRPAAVRSRSTRTSSQIKDKAAVFFGLAECSIYDGDLNMATEHLESVDQLLEPMIRTTTFSPSGGGGGRRRVDGPAVELMACYSKLIDVLELRQLPHRAKAVSLKLDNLQRMFGNPLAGGEETEMGGERGARGTMSIMSTGGQ